MSKVASGLDAIESILPRALVSAIARSLVVFAVVSDPELELKCGSVGCYRPFAVESDGRKIGNY